MKRILKLLLYATCALATFVAGADLRPAFAGNFSSQFDAGLPAGATVFNSASVQPGLGWVALVLWN